MKRSVAVVFFHATLLSFILPAGGCRKASTSSNGRIPLVFWHSFVPATFPALDSLIVRYEKENPCVRIVAQYVPTGDALMQKLAAAVQSRSAPDISWIHSDFLEVLVSSESLIPMETFLDGPGGLSLEERDDIFAPLLETATWKDTLFAMPMEATTLALLYNRTLFREAGLDPDRPPRTWDELLASARRLTLDRNADGKTDQYGFYIPVFPASGALSIWMILQWVPFLWQAGGTEADVSQTVVLFNSDAGVKALSLWKEIFDFMDFRKFSLAHDLGFASGTLAMVMDGPWNLPRYRSLKNVDWAVAPLPAGPKGQATVLAGEHLAIFKQSRHPEAAWSFVRFVLRPDVQAQFSMQSGYLPVRKSVLQRKNYQEFLQADPPLKAFADQMIFGRVRRPIGRYRMEINHRIAEAIERSLIGGVDPKTALDQAAFQSNALLQSHP